MVRLCKKVGAQQKALEASLGSSRQPLTQNIMVKTENPYFWSTACIEMVARTCKISTSSKLNILQKLLAAASRYFQKMYSSHDSKVLAVMDLHPYYSVISA